MCVCVLERPAPDRLNKTLAQHGQPRRGVWPREYGAHNSARHTRTGLMLSGKSGGLVRSGCPSSVELALPINHIDLMGAANSTERDDGDGLANNSPPRASRGQLSGKSSSCGRGDKQVCVCVCVEKHSEQK